MARLSLWNACAVTKSPSSLALPPPADSVPETRSDQETARQKLKELGLEQKELAEVLRKLLAELKPPQGEILADFFQHALSYEEIAKKHGLALGSVGVYLKRGLEAIRRAWGRQSE